RQDLRDMFRRFTGTDADTANARALGSRQAAQVRVKSKTWRIVGTDSDSSIYSIGGGNTQGISQMDSLLPDAGTAETRPRNVAFHPRIHA
ncbi:phage tail protein, partial [Achromobacter ruhlandii]|nr:phage tail protein [Achromobacter ruhlandii]